MSGISALASGSTAILLQVTGEGRLTDALGRTTDFGNAVIVLTSNLGTREAGTTVGFRAGASSEAPHFLRAAERFFRPEFFNRLDRVVPFDRLSRNDVRKIAELVIGGVFQREGLVRRKCVLEVDPQALDRVVEQGYHPTLGARALKREIERQLTQPVSQRLAATPPDAATVISLYPAPAGIAVQVQTLVEAQALPHRRDAENPSEVSTVGWPSDLAKWDKCTERHFLRELAAVDDIHTYLREAFSNVPRFGHQLIHQLERLEYEIALVELMSRFDGAADDAVMILSVQGPRQTFADKLSRWYLELFGDGLSLDCQALPADETLRALVVSGPHARAVAGIEQGTHLFCPRNANLAPLPIWVLPVTNARAAATVDDFSRRRREWLRSLADGSGSVDEDPFPLPPVVRIYNAGGPTFDLRSGISAAGEPTLDDLRTFALAALPPASAAVNR